MHKNPHCLSGGNNIALTTRLSFRPSFGDFLRRNLNFLAKRSSLDFFVTFCVKTKSKEIITLESPPNFQNLREPPLRNMQYALCI